jgi:hypothetical protein
VAAFLAHPEVVVVMAVLTVFGFGQGFGGHILSATALLGCALVATACLLLGIRK